MAATLDFHGETVTIGHPERLFQLSSRVSVAARDGRRFLTYEPEPGTELDRHMIVRLNWLSQLRK